MSSTETSARTRSTPRRSTTARFIDGRSSWPSGECRREHGRDPGLAEARSRCGLRRRRLLLEGHGARHEFLTANNQTPYVLHGFRPPAAGRCVLEVPARADKTVFVRQRHRHVGGAAGRHRRHGDDAGKAASTCSCRPATIAQDPRRLSSSCRRKRCSSTSACARSPSARARSPTLSPTAS